MTPFARAAGYLFACLLAACASTGRPAPARASLSFAVIADSDAARLAGALHEPQSLPALGVDAPPPELLLVCGTPTAGAGRIEDWSAAEQVFDGLGLPWFAVAGGSEMPWGWVLEGFDKRFGGLVYSFDRSGAHFIALCSASVGDPRPSFSPLQLAWLREDLARNADRKPVFVFMHHAPVSAELAPAQMLELQAAFDGHDVAALFFGERRGMESAPGVRRVGGLDCVQSGGTFDEPGACVLVSIVDGKLRVAYRYLDPAREPRLLLEKTLRYRPRAPLSIEKPPAGAPARDGELSIVVQAPSAPRSFLLDGRPKPLDWRREEGAWLARLPLSDLVVDGPGGAHRLAVGCDDEGAPRLATRVFIAPSEAVQMRWRRNFAGSLRSTPVWACGKLAIASTAGEVAVLDPESGELLWSAQTSAVIGSPLGCDDGGVVIGNTRGWVEAFDGSGARRWRFQLGAPILAGLAGDGELVFAADARGGVHALELATGARRWRADGPGCNVETAPRVADGRLVLRGGGAELVLDIRTGALLEHRSNVQSERMGAGEVAGRIARVSELGLIELIDAASGSPLWTWRATADGYVFAPALLRADGTVWIAAIDGSLSCVRAR